MQSEQGILASLKTDSLSFIEALYPAKYCMPAHSHPHAQLVLCLSGGIEHQAGRDRHFFSENSSGFVPAGEKHSDLFFGNVRAFQICLRDAHRELSPTSCSSLIFDRHHPSTALMKSAYREFKNPDSYTPIMLESLTTELLVCLNRKQDQASTFGGQSRWLDRVREILHEEFSESLRIDDIAAKVGVHPAHLTKAFRKQFGESIGEYIRRLRVARARHLLETSEMTIGAIALETGFVDQSHFTRTFKKYTGRTPNSFRGCP